jgi:hypothetical protein
MFHNLRNAVMCLWTWVGSNSALIAQTLARLGPTNNLENKTKKTQHPHQVESSVDSIVRRHKSANRKSFLNSAWEWYCQWRAKVDKISKECPMREHRRETSSALWTSSAQPVPVLSLTTSFRKDYWNGYCDFKQAGSCMNPFSTMFLENASFYELSFQLSLIIRCPSKNAL